MRRVILFGLLIALGVGAYFVLKNPQVLHITGRTISLKTVQSTSSSTLNALQEKLNATYAATRSAAEDAVSDARVTAARSASVAADQVKKKTPSLIDEAQEYVGTLLSKSQNGSALSDGDESVVICSFHSRNDDVRYAIQNSDGARLSYSVSW